MVNIALRIILHDKVRFFITVSGVAFAVALVCSQVGLFAGLLANATVTIEKADASIWVTSKNTPNVDIPIPFSESYVQRVRSVPGVTRADNMIVWFHRITLPNGATESILLYALENFERWNIPWKLQSGSLADLRSGNYLMMDESARYRYGDFHVGSYREIGNRRLKVIGISEEAKSFTTTPMGFIDYKTIQEIDPVSLFGKTTYILVKVAEGADVEAVREEIQRRLPYHDVHLRDTWAARSRRYWIANTGLGMIQGLTVFLGCLVGVVIVTQTLYTSVMDHFKEFATVKAIGGTNKDIYQIIAKQSIIASVLGFIIGSGITMIVQHFVPKSAPALLLTPGVYVTVFIMTVILCLLASLVSFNKISKLDPAIVFRS